MRKSRYPLPDVRFLAKVNRNSGVFCKRTGTECHLWTGGKHPSGYGGFQVNGKGVYVHVYAFERESGPVPKGKEVCHTCNHRACVRRSHLYAGTQKNNAADREFDGTTAKGETSGLAVLTELKVIEIREAYARGGKTQKDLAATYGVSVMTVNYVINRKTWSHVA